MRGKGVVEERTSGGDIASLYFAMSVVIMMLTFPLVDFLCYFMPLKEMFVSSGGAGCRRFRC